MVLIDIENRGLSDDFSPPATSGIEIGDDRLRRDIVSETIVSSPLAVTGAGVHIGIGAGAARGETPRVMLVTANADRRPYTVDILLTRRLGDFQWPAGVSIRSARINRAFLARVPCTPFRNMRRLIRDAMCGICGYARHVLPITLCEQTGAVR